MVRIVIVTAGSRGDVAPFTGLGQRLQHDGHQVAVAAHQRFADVVRGSGLEYRPLGTDASRAQRAGQLGRVPEQFAIAEPDRPLLDRGRVWSGRRLLADQFG